MKEKKVNQPGLSQGYIAFTSLIVIAAVVLAISISIVLLSVTESQSSLSYKKGQESLQAAVGCTEEAMLRLHDDASYTGGSLTVGNVSCTIGVSGSVPNFTINIVTSLTGPPSFSQSLRLTVRRAGNHINLLSWQQIE